jgi:hypothetical protein
LAAVLAMAPVAGIPPKRPEKIFPSPCPGLTPDAIARAIDSGRAMMATMIPEMISFISCSFV